jgi:thermitase
MNYVMKLSKLVLLLGLLLLAACSQTPTPRASADSDFSRVATVSISSADTEASLEAQYGGKVILLNAKAGLAMLGFTNQADQFTALTTTTNQNAFGTPEVTAAGTSAWGGGQNAWGGGKSAWGGGWNAWGGGWNAWGGGTSMLPSLPSENRAAWRDIRLPQAQALSKNFGAGIKIAVIDTGIDLNHSMFSGHLAPSTEWKDFVDGDATPQEVAGSSYGHGTAVAGIILQAAPRATILPIRVLGADGVGDTDNIALAIDWAIQKGAKVINLSLGSPVQVPALQSWVGYALSQGIYVVTSAGNSAGILTYPAADAGTMVYNGTNFSKYLISVGSVSNSGSRSSFSCFGIGLEVMAPGEVVYSAFPDGQTGHATGTSFAAPQVSGVLALALADTAVANRGNLQNYLSQSAQSLGTGNGFGLFNAVGFMTKLPDLVRRNALFVVYSTSLNSGDSAFKSRLESMGYTVTVKNQNAIASDATGKDVVVISSSVDDEIVMAKFRDVTIPVVTWEEYLFDNMRFNGGYEETDNYSTYETETKVRMTNSTHPLAAGYTGDVTAFNAVNEMAWSKLTSASGAIKVATLTGDSTKAVIFGFDKGAQMSGMTAPARRVGIFHNYWGAAHTTQGWNFFDAAVTWAVTGN